MSCRHPLSTLSVLALALAGGSLLAESVSSGTVLRAADAWLQRHADLGRPAAGRRVRSVEPRRHAAGEVLFHVARLEPEGFIILSPDDHVEPVLAFSTEGRLDLDTPSPLLDILDHDAPRLLQAARRMAKQPVSRAFQVERSPGQTRWDRLLGRTASREAGLAAVTDPRVDPFVGSRWSQGFANGLFTYNYFVPNHYLSGCVATAMAQIMRFHSWPTAPIGPKPFSIKVDGVSRDVVARGGNGLGGAYVWSQMPLVPTDATTDAERQMIGSLMFDAGASVNMEYEAQWSGSDTLKAATALTGTFLYGNAMQGYAAGTELTGSGLDRMVLPNLDAGLPVIFGINGPVTGHAIVCDGYGYAGTTLYHHLNMGWGGLDDAWYYLPRIDSSPSFDIVYKCIYNIYPTGSGEILSGRVLDGAGSPVGGVTVSNGAVTTATNSRGIWALAKVQPGWQTLTATKGALSFPNANLKVVASKHQDLVGNRWGISLTQGALGPSFLQEIGFQEVKAGATPEPVLAEVMGAPPFHYAWKKNGVATGTDAPTLPFTLPVTRADIGTTLSVRVTNDHGSAESAGGLAVVDLLNAGFERGLIGWQAYNFAMHSGLSPEAAPHGGKYWLYVGDWQQPVTDWVRQAVAIPSTATTASVQFWLGIKNRASAPSTQANVFTVKVLDESLAPLETLATRDNRDAALQADGTVVWKQVGPFNLGAYKGRTVHLQFGSTQPGGDNTGTVFAVDDVTVAISETFNATVAPATCTVATGGTFPFRASILGTPSDNRVNWTSSGGVMSPAQTAADGVAVSTWTAPAAPGTCTLTATPLVAGGVAGTATATVVDPAAVQVGLTPASAQVGITVPVVFAATVTPLTQNTVTWSCDGGTFSNTGGSATTWTASAPGSYTIRATAAGAPTRYAEATVSVVDPGAVNLVMSPSAKTLLPGASHAFAVTGDLGGGVDWTCTGGLTPLASGLSALLTVPGTAPLATQGYTLTARSRLNTARTASAEVKVKGVDLNGDGILDLQDMLVLAAEFGKGVASPANLKGEGTVGDADLTALLLAIQ